MSYVANDLLIRFTQLEEARKIAAIYFRMNVKLQQDLVSELDMLAKRINQLTEN